MPVDPLAGALPDSGGNATGSASTVESWEPKVLMVLEEMRSNGMDLTLLLERVMIARSKKIREKREAFFANDGFKKIFQAILPQMSFDFTKKAKLKRCDPEGKTWSGCRPVGSGSAGIGIGNENICQV